MYGKLTLKCLEVNECQNILHHVTDQNVYKIITREIEVLYYT